MFPSLGGFKLAAGYILPPQSRGKTKRIKVRPLAEKEESQAERQIVKDAMHRSRQITATLLQKVRQG